MNKDRESRGKVKIPGKIDIELAVDADLNSLWKSKRYPSPRQMINIQKAILGGLTEEMDRTDKPNSPSKN
jgi:hypothetical protein